MPILYQVISQLSEMRARFAVAHQRNTALLEKARKALADFGGVTETLLRRIDAAASADIAWRGARPLGARMDERCRLPDQAPSATLIAVDGSQSYPSAHDAFTYYLLSTGSMVLREGVGQAPATESRVIVRYPEQEGEAWQDRIPDRTQVNEERDELEFRTLTDLARAERMAVGPDRMLLALRDGPISHCLPKALPSGRMSVEIRPVHRHARSPEGSRRYPSRLC